MTDQEQNESTPMDSGQRLVFVSHSGRDTWVAKQIAAEIAERGATTFLDEAEIRVGSDHEQDIRSALAHADELVVLLTPWALEPPYVWAEMGAAWVRGIPIVGVLHGLTPKDVQSRPGMPVFLKERYLVDINSLDRYIEQLGTRGAEYRTRGEEVSNDGEVPAPANSQEAIPSLQEGGAPSA